MSESANYSVDYTQMGVAFIVEAHLIDGKGSDRLDKQLGALASSDVLDLLTQLKKQTLRRLENACMDSSIGPTGFNQVRIQVAAVTTFIDALFAAGYERQVEEYSRQVKIRQAVEVPI